MTALREEIVAKVWRGQDPFQGFPDNVYQTDPQGWGAEHPYMTDFLVANHEPLILEVGVWKGASVLKMSEKMRELAINGAVIAVDTWLGAADHWIQGEWFSHLGWDHGYPSLNRKFMANVTNAGLQNYVIPLPLDSINASEVLKHYNIILDVIHIDAGHEYNSVISDLNSWWPLLRPGGMLIGDDYYPDTHWPGVREAFDEFFSGLDLMPLENFSGKCRVIKPSHL